MSDVAAAAGVSRQTRNMEFSSREVFARPLILSVSDRMIGAVGGAPSIAELLGYDLERTLGAGIGV
jgi:hypothetical protein